MTVSAPVMGVHWASAAVMLQTLPGGFSLVQLGIAGGSGIATVAAVRWLLKRAAPEFTVTESTTAASVTSTASLSGGSVSKDNVAFTLPGFLPVSKGIRQVSHNEVHAFELGLVVGIVVTWLYASGNTGPVATILTVFVAGTLGFRRYRSKAFRTTRHEPWYALVALVLGCALSYAAFVVGLPGV